MSNRRRKLAKAVRKERRMRYELLSDPMVNHARFLQRMQVFEALQAHIAGLAR